MYGTHGISPKHVLTYERYEYLTSNGKNWATIGDSRSGWLNGNFCVQGGNNVMQGIMLQAIYVASDQFSIDDISVTEGCSLGKEVYSGKL